MWRKIEQLILTALLVLLSCGCARGEESTLIIGRSGEETGSLTLAAAEESGQEISGSAGTVDEADIYVYVCGAVKTPGVVSLSPGSRVEDALKAAGGFAEDADRSYVNLADWVEDGQQIYFPTQEEGKTLQESKEAASGGKVNINTADVAGLCTLTGIGESRAQDIIAYREANGGFAVEKDIMKVPGIKDSVYNKISDKITVK